MGGQAIPAFDFYMAPYVKLSYKEEWDKVCQAVEVDYPVEYPEDYHYVELPKISTVPNHARSTEHIKQIAINNTINRVHQAMESFIHNMNSIHSRGGRR